jgi:hypothetical protein
LAKASTLKGAFFFLGMILGIADVIELIDTEDITGYIPAEKTDRA